jgi:hypothetical protein
MAKWWLHWKKFKAINVTNAVALWATFENQEMICVFRVGSGGGWRN